MIWVLVNLCAAAIPHLLLTCQCSNGLLWRQTAVESVAIKSCAQIPFYTWQFKADREKLQQQLLERMTDLLCYAA
jgi:hypothetical protein